MTSRDFTREAEGIFAAFAARHGLSHEVDRSAPVEVCWRFPVQPGLSETIVLALQNGDELNFGVGEFWSYFFPFKEKVAEFEHVLSAWMAGEGRVISRLFSENLQVWDGVQWRTVYGAGRLWPEFRVGRIVQNRRT